MLKFKQILSTVNKTAGKNTCQFIVLHHTGTGEGTIKGNLNVFTKKTKYNVSCHYVVDINGDIYKIGEDTDILWHAGQSVRKGLTNLNDYAIGIEVIGPLKDGGFTDEQRKSVGKLILELSQKHGIGKGNVLRHKDIAPARKTDIADSFWNGSFNSWTLYVSDLFENQPILTKYSEILEELVDAGFDPLFTEHKGSGILSEQETKELIEIAFARFAKRNNLK